MNKNPNTTTNINASATNASGILSGNTEGMSQNNAQLLECLNAKLDQILAVQLRLEALFATQSSHLGSVSQSIQASSASINA